MSEMDPGRQPDIKIPEGNLVKKTVFEPNGDSAEILPILAPKIINSFAWRAILEHQIHAESPLTFSIDLDGGGNAIITNEDFYRANYYSDEQIRNFLDEKVGILENAKTVFLGRRAN